MSSFWRGVVNWWYVKPPKHGRAPNHPWNWRDEGRPGPISEPHRQCGWFADSLCYHTEPPQRKGGYE